jgi:hypothetical protein
LLPHPCGLPRYAGGSASASSLSRPAQASLLLRPAGSLSRPRRPLSRGFRSAGYPTDLLVSYQTYRHLSGWIPPPLVTRALRGTQRNPGLLDAPCNGPGFRGACHRARIRATRWLHPGYASRNDALRATFHQQTSCDLNLLAAYTCAPARLERIVSVEHSRLCIHGIATSLCSDNDGRHGRRGGLGLRGHRSGPPQR